MAMRYPGGVIPTKPTITPPSGSPPEGGSASGIWTLEQQFQNANVWPRPLILKGLWTWGLNNSGVLGHNDEVRRSSPVQVGALTDWALISGTAGIAVAIKTNGTLWSWGANGSGQLGQNDRVYRSSPVQIGALTTWLKITAHSHTIATKTDGTLWAWGDNGSGRLGLGNITNYSSPKQVGALTTWIAVSCGNNFTISTKS